MTYIKINKDSLDYHQFANFHAYTMNNFIRSVMRKGKYKKATRLVRLGLLFSLKRIHYNLKRDNVKFVWKTFRRMRHTMLSETTKNQLPLELEEEKLELKENRPYIKAEILDKIKDQTLINPSTEYYANLINQLKLANDSFSEGNFSFFRYYKYLANKSIFEKNFEKQYKENISDIYHVEPPVVPLPLNHLHFQQQVISQKLKFRKIYTKKPPIWFFRTRNLSVFDMIIQAYSILTGIWHMRRIKVSGRTVLVPSPLRPHRRIATVTKMLLKGIRQLRRSERFNKKAMIYSIGMEFYYLVIYYGRQFKHPNITASYVWQLKLQSHKELVANLKNIKHMNHY